MRGLVTVIDHRDDRLKACDGCKRTIRVAFSGHVEHSPTAPREDVIKLREWPGR